MYIVLTLFASGIIPGSISNIFNIASLVVELSSSSSDLSLMFNAFSAKSPASVRCKNSSSQEVGDDALG